GVAAHWKYKQNGQGAGDEKNYEWVRRLLENQEGADAEEFIHSLKVDLFADEVFVFTPAGDVINLPAGATPIDFAYTIHSQVGNHMVAAKVNGRIVQFDHKLNNGDVVEVETSPSAHGPSRDWIKIAKSSNARSKIRQWFKKERREENVINGKASFENELKRAGITLKELISEDNLPAVLEKAGYNALDDMYAAIGYGGVTALKVVGRLREEINRILRAHQIAPAEPETPEAEKPGPAHYVPGTHGVVVEGIDNCLVKLAKCCSPVPGDEIMGFITRGSGVSVHRADCPNAAPERRAPEEDGRWIKVSWAENPGSQYQTTLEVISRDRSGLMVDISTVISSTKTQFRGLSAQIIPDGSVLVTMDVIVSDAEQLKTVMRRLEQISGVQSVSRPAK
ncbi:MAG: bifunctional (p)ppGpp synthetase/guanosine-3',5'-bis(diphosphate) 3'-pyrophosphohydrolase, partial [Oscillospiraceae bacterium]|nr:bifunctional (p)ppGpp synthetase/guanosine-3',5'-bis(diphosphate) 3'-pyrophosphohydrolase [Oscillospiraceae bacterium]